MVDERDISQELKWSYEERAKAVTSNLRKRDINAQYVPSQREALSAVMEMIPEGATVACGDSVTLEQIGVLDELRKRKQYKLIDPLARTEDGHYVLGKESRLRTQKEAFLADVFLTGTNAITHDGKLVSIDALGNRVAPMIFGPEKVIVVAGVNKICKDVTQALERIHQVAAPLVAQRHYLKHHIQEFGDLPCVRTGRCVDCIHESKICLNTVIIEGTYTLVKGRINVVLVGEELGL
jgi:L-lactate utilization protein LutB